MYACPVGGRGWFGKRLAQFSGQEKGGKTFLLTQPQYSDCGFASLPRTGVLLGSKTVAESSLWGHKQIHIIIESSGPVKEKQQPLLISVHINIEFVESLTQSLLFSTVWNERLKKNCFLNFSKCTKRVGLISKPDTKPDTKLYLLIEISASRCKIQVCFKEEFEPLK